MSRPLKKSSFDAEQIQKDLIAAVTDSYNSPDDTEQEHKPLATVAEEFSITPLKARKFLITDDTYEMHISAEVTKLYASGKTVAEIRKLLHFSRASVQFYLPYRKGVYNAKELISRKEKSVTRSSVEAAYRRVAELQQAGETGAEPKQLGMFGASYTGVVDKTVWRKEF